MDTVSEPDDLATHLTASLQNLEEHKGLGDDLPHMALSLQRKCIWLIDMKRCSASLILRGMKIGVVGYISFYPKY